MNQTNQWDVNLKLQDGTLMLGLILAATMDKRGTTAWCYKALATAAKYRIHLFRKRVRAGHNTFVSCLPRSSPVHEYELHHRL